MSTTTAAAHYGKTVRTAIREGAHGDQIVAVLNMVTPVRTGCMSHAAAILDRADVRALIVANPDDGAVVEFIEGEALPCDPQWCQCGPVLSPAD